MENANLLSVVIVDDEIPACNRLRDLLQDCQKVVPTHLVGMAHHAETAWRLLENEQVDVIFLDVRMPEQDGLQLAQRIQQQRPAVQVIFTTAYDEYAVQAFEVNAIDYLVKPMRRERVQAALQKALQARAPVSDMSVRQHIRVTERGHVVLVPLSEILFFKAEDKYVLVQTPTRQYWLEESLNQLEQTFAQRVMRIHRACLVVTNEIRRFERLTDQSEHFGLVYLTNWEEGLPVSRRQYSAVKTYMDKKGIV